MRISIITVTKNNKTGLLRAIECVRSQTYKNIEHIIVDGDSTDGTKEILRSAQNDTLGHFDRLSAGSAQGNRLPTTHLLTGQAGYQLHTISEPDNGIYDAINKGIKLATGDVIGLLHSDDLYADEKVIERYAKAFDADSGSESGMTVRIDAVYSDLVYVKFSQEVARQKFQPKAVQPPAEETRSEKIDFGFPKSGTSSSGMTKHSTTNLPTGQAGYSIIRNWKTHKSLSSNQNSVNSSLTNHYSLITDNLLRKGWMPPHPTLIIRKDVFDKYGLYRTDMKIAADYELILRLLYKHKITARYLPFTTYLMSLGGVSNKSLKNILQKSKEDLKGMKFNGISYPLVTLISKNIRKLPQFLVRSL